MYALLYMYIVLFYTICSILFNDTIYNMLYAIYYLFYFIIYYLQYFVVYYNIFGI